MEPLLGLHTSPNSLQLPSGATLKADNVYLDTDGYFKPFKKVEKVFTDLQMVGNTGSTTGQWNDANYRRNIFVKNGYLFWADYDISSPNNPTRVRINTTPIKTTELSGSAVLAEISVGHSYGARYANSDDQTINYATKFFPFIEVSDFFVFCNITNSPDWQLPNFCCIGTKEITNPNSSTPLVDVKMSIPPPDIISTAYATPSSRVYDGDAANNSDKFYANAYRFTLSFILGDYLIESKPTGSIYVRGSNASAPPGAWVGQIDMTLPGQIGNPVTNFYLNIYRTTLEFADNATTDFVPRESDDYRLVESINFKSTTNSYSFTDDFIMPPGSAELYTNASQDGVIQQNEELPKFKLATYYKGYAFYGNIEILQPLTLSIKQGNVGTYQGFWILSYSVVGRQGRAIYEPLEYDVDLTNTFPANGDDSNSSIGLLYDVDGLFYNYGSNVNVYHANSSGTGVTAVVSLKTLEVAYPVTFLDRSGVFDAATYSNPSTAYATITKVAHGLSSGDWIFIYFIDGGYQGYYTEDTITVVGPDTFTVPFDGTGFNPTVGSACQFVSYTTGTQPEPSGIFTNITKSGYTFTAKELPNAMVYSKYLQPFTTTLPNTYTIGSSAPMLFLANLREYLLILKSDGVYILRGTNPDNFTIDPIYPQLILTDSRAIQVIDDFVIGLFTIGVVRLNENGYEVISKPIKDDIQNMVLGIGANGADISNYPPISFYHKSKRLFMIGREQVSVEPDSTTTDQGEMFPAYLAHDAFCYHIDSEQWTKTNKVFLDGACEVGNEIYFSTVGNRTTAVVPPNPDPSFNVNFRTDIYRTTVENTTDSYTRDFSIRFVKKLATEDGKGGHFRYLKLYFREMNLTSVTVRYYNNYDFTNNNDYFDAVYDDIVTFDNDLTNSYSRSVAYLMIPMEVARGEWLSFEIFNTVSSEVDILKYNGILLEGVELVTTPGKSVTI